MFKINPFKAAFEAVTLLPKVKLWFLVVYTPYFLITAYLTVLGLFSALILSFFVLGILCYFLEGINSGNEKAFIEAFRTFSANLKSCFKSFIKVSFLFWGWLILIGLVAGMAWSLYQIGNKDTVPPPYKIGFYSAGVILSAIVFKMFVQLMQRYYIALIHLFLGSEKKIWRDAKRLMKGHRFSFLISWSLFAIPIISFIILSALSIVNGVVEFILMIFVCVLRALASLVPVIYYKKMVALDVSSEQAQEKMSDNRLSGTMPEGTVGV